MIEHAARSLREWDERMAEDGISLGWMIISNADPLHQSGTFIKNLAQEAVRELMIYCGKRDDTPNIPGFSGHRYTIIPKNP